MSRSSWLQSGENLLSVYESVVDIHDNVRVDWQDTEGKRKKEKEGRSKRKRGGWTKG